MSENDQNGEPLDFRLAKEIRDLEVNVMPGRDLWPGIERRIADIPQGRGLLRTERLLVMGVAASLIVAVTTLMIVLYQFDELDQARQLTLEQSLQQMQTEYRNVKAPLLMQWEDASSTMDPETMLVLQRNLEIIERAREDIEAALKANPESEKLMEMLTRLHQQEIEMLNQEYLTPPRNI